MPTNTKNKEEKTIEVTNQCVQNNIKASDLSNL